MSKKEKTAKTKPEAQSEETETIQEPTATPPEPSLQVRMIEWAKEQPLGATFTMEEAAAIFNVSVEEFRANFMILRQTDPKLDGLLVYPR